MEGGGKKVTGSSQMLGNENILEYSLTFEQTNILEGSGNPQLCDLIRRGNNGMSIFSIIFSLIKLLLRKSVMNLV